MQSSPSKSDNLGENYTSSSITSSQTQYDRELEKDFVLETLNASLTKLDETPVKNIEHHTANDTQ